MTGSYWTPQEISRLSKLWSEGKPTRQIALRLPGRNRNMVIGKARRIGLDPRPSPIVGRGASREA